MAELEISRELIHKAMTHPDVIAQLAVVAKRIAARANSLARSEGVDLTVTVQTGIRPGGRPFANVVGDNGDQEFGTAETPRSRILGRASARTTRRMLGDAAANEGG